MVGVSICICIYIFITGDIRGVSWVTDGNCETLLVTHVFRLTSTCFLNEHIFTFFYYGINGEIKTGITSDKTANKIC